MGPMGLPDSYVRQFKKTPNREPGTVNGELRTENRSPARPDIDRVFPIEHADRIEGGGIGNQDTVLLH